MIYPFSVKELITLHANDSVISHGTEITLEALFSLFGDAAEAPPSLIKPH